jgi:hypothetical protein
MARFQQMACQGRICLEKQLVAIFFRFSGRGMAIVVLRNQQFMCCRSSKDVCAATYGKKNCS